MNTLRINRRTFLGPWCGSLISAGLLAWSDVTAGQAAQPNIVIIMADDLGYGDLGGVWGGKANTPHLDQLAAQGLRFTDYHSSGPVCTPTRAALMTGRYPLRLGMDKAFNHPFNFNGWQDLGIAAEHNQNEITLATYLRRAGYATGIFGKWHLGKNVAANPVRHGFDEFRGLTCGCGDYFSKTTRFGEPDWWHNDAQEFQEGYSTIVNTDNAVRFVERHAAKPFFLYVPYSAIHFPWQDAGDGGRPVRRAGKPVNRAGEVNKIGPHMDPAEVPAVAQRMIEEMDTGVGRIVAALRQRGLDRNTLVIFTSDNGGQANYPVDGVPVHISSNGPLRGGKGQVYEGGHRVPAIAWWPGRIAPNTVTTETVVTMDLVPTALELAGVPLPAKEGPNAFDGVSLLPVLLRREGLKPRTLFWQSPPSEAGKSHWGVRQGPWKLVNRELYNLTDDLSESHDLAAARPDLVKDLVAKRDAWEGAIRASKNFLAHAPERAKKARSE